MGKFVFLILCFLFLENSMKNKRKETKDRKLLE